MFRRNIERRKILLLPGLEHRPLGRPASRQSLYRLRYPGSLQLCRWKNVTSESRALSKRHRVTHQRTIQMQIKFLLLKRANVSRIHFLLIDYNYVMMTPQCFDVIVGYDAQLLHVYQIFSATEVYMD
jgi:hypothetical protein